MKLIKRLVPNKIRQEISYLLKDLLKIKYSRTGAPTEILKWLPKGKSIVFFDIGANAGDFTNSICGEYQVEKAVIVEPLVKLTPILQKRFPNDEVFKILNIAVAESNDEQDFYVNDEFDAVSSLLKIRNESDELKSLNLKDPVSSKIQTRTLDHISKDLNLSHIDFIKIDVQGAEHLVLQSGTETLKITKLVYTEFSYTPLYEGSSTFFDLYKILYQNNFILVNVSPGHSAANGELLQGDALFINKGLIN